ncbi:VOC family protein [Streptomyces sp. NPDC001843]|uniref:VOC family protein n=1 Tax=Streptomyces sp. NPDC001843 TaxID=3364617 RepID=UPI0036BBB668
MTEARGPFGPRGGTHGRRAPGTPCWVSLMVHGLTATERFYGGLFGWKFEPGPQQLGPYSWALLDGHRVGGIGQLAPDLHLPIAWTPHFATDDVDRTAETVRLCGGTVGVGPVEARGTGRLVIGSDTSGAVFGVWQGVPGTGTAVIGVHGTPAWTELLTFETASVTKFYKALFGYEEEQVVCAGVDYVTLRLDGVPVAGVHGVGHSLPRDRGSHWLTYFQVEDADDALRRVAELGGRVLEPAHDSAHGRVAKVADPEGALFAVVQDPR